MALIEFVKPSEAKYRLEMCKGNEEYYPCDSYFKLTGTCKKCGCFVKAKTKVYKRGNHIEKCPLNKW
jgi:hypothetical protein|tara:strand:+ start:1868 stop:2068 length:201 start_codon:yes stop_codon:yes gene_type:complete